jgi:hypothetical protein
MTAATAAEVTITAILAFVGFCGFVMYRIVAQDFRDRSGGRRG